MAAKRSRAVSPELGGQLHSVNYNERTGRPIRKSAGKKPSIPGFISSEEAINDESATESDVVDLDSDGETSEHQRKRAHPPSPEPSPELSPTPPPLSPVPRDEFSSVEPESEPQLQGENSVSLVFHVPPGYTGPFVVKLDRNLTSDLSNSSQLQVGTACQTAAKTASEGVKGDEKTSGRKTFVDLPAELRNKVYRSLFVADRPLSFSNPDNFSLSAAFLRTCRQVYEEGRSILYAENTFDFERNKHIRGNFWSAQRKEIGYKDMRLFLSMIGTHNVSLLTSIEMCFEDASPSSTAYLTAEERRYWNDEHLLDCLRTLARHANLTVLQLKFNGRKGLTGTDSVFINTLKRVKVDSLVIKPLIWQACPRVSYATRMFLQKEMTRTGA